MDINDKNHIFSFFIGVVVCIIFVFTLYIQGCHSWFSDISFSKEVDPFDIYNLLITTGLGVIIAWFISKKSNEDRYEKEFLINDMMDFERKLTDLSNKALSSRSMNILYPYINDAYNCHKRFVHSLNLIGFDCIEVKDVGDGIISLYEIGTNVEDDSLEISIDDQTEISTLCSNLIFLSRNMIHLINNK